MTRRRPLVARLCAPLPALLFATLIGTTAHAQKAAPGLWEHTMQMKSQSGQIEAGLAQMREELARMPPEQRQQMEQMMAQRGLGISPAGTAARVCITPEQAARDQMPQPDGRCSQQSVQRSGNVLKIKFVCSGDPPARGEGEYTFSSDKAFSGRMQVDTVVQGKPEQMTMTSSSRWLGADCGAIVPMQR
jgi:hypothetical protein